MVKKTILKFSNSSYLVDFVRIERSLICVDLTFRQLNHVVDCLAANFSENCVRFLKLWSRIKCEKELHVVVTALIIGYCNKSPSGESKSRMKFIFDWLNAVSFIGIFATLNDETGNKSMKRCFVVKAVEA